MTAVAQANEIARQRARLASLSRCSGRGNEGEGNGACIFAEEIE